MDRLGGRDVVRVEEVELRDPGPGEVRIAVEVAGINFSDVMIREGWHSYRPALPYVLGQECCGRIEAVGPGVSRLQVGERVAALLLGGGLAERVITHSQALLTWPEGLSAETVVALLVQGMTAWHCVVDRAQTQPGEWVLVHAAAGGVGSLAIQIARARGAQVIGTASTEAKRSAIEKLGAHAIDYTRDEWVEQVLGLTGGLGADVILESVGGSVFLRSFFEALADFGRLVVYGSAGQNDCVVSNRDIGESNRQLLGYSLGRFFPRHAGLCLSAWSGLMDLAASARLQPLIFEVRPLRDVPDALEDLRMRRTTGKLLLRP